MLTTKDKSYIENLMENKLENKLTQFRSDILNHVDAVMGEVKAMREDFAILNQRSADNRNSIENHEERIESLEKLNLSI